MVVARSLKTVEYCPESRRAKGERVFRWPGQIAVSGCSASSADRLTGLLGRARHRNSDGSSQISTNEATTVVESAAAEDKVDCDDWPANDRCGDSTESYTAEVINSSYCDRLRTVQNILALPALGFGTCQACGIFGRLHGSGIFCQRDNLVWCQAYLDQGVMLDSSQLPTCYLVSNFALSTYLL